MEIETIYTPDAPQPIGPYSQGKKVGGIIYTAGQIGMDVSGELADGVAAQTYQAIKNLATILEAGGASLERVIKTTVFLQDMNDFTEMNGVYATYFSSGAPARSTVQAARLPKDALVEIEAVAVAG